MQTITFYSYNGGTGRTLAVANAAKYLIRLGQKVFAIDLDLEAPGLHYKLGLGAQEASPPIVRGVVDYLHSFCVGKKLPESLAEYTVRVRTEAGRDDAITLMPAGNVPCADYWRQLTQINWHELFYSATPKGVPLFLELKARIEKEYSPDFLLIDSRTGITEIGGVATTVMPDRVVCLLLNNRQNLDGSRAVLQGIQNAQGLSGNEHIEIIPVLCRFPEKPRRQLGPPRRQLGLSRRQPGIDDEQATIAEVRRVLCHDTASGKPDLELPDLLVLHSEESLQYSEALRIGGPQSVDESPLLRDYLRLFSRLVPNDAVDPHLGSFIQATMLNMIDEPDKVQRDLEALAEYRPHAKTYEALIKYYRMRNVGSARMLRAASRLWELSRDSLHPLLWEIVKQHFPYRGKERTRESLAVSTDFIDDVWTAAGANDIEVGSQLADLCFSHRDPRKAVDVLRRLVASTDGDATAVVASIHKLIEAEQGDSASELTKQFEATLAGDTEFQRARARLIVATNDAADAKRLLEGKEFRPAQLQISDPMLYVRLLRLAGQTEEPAAALLSALKQLLTSRNFLVHGMSSELLELGRMFLEFGKPDVLEETIKGTLPRQRAKRVLEMLGFQR